MQRLALFDLDRTLIDLDAAFLRWAEEFGEVRRRFALTDPVEELWAAYRRRMPSLVQCYPGVLDGLAELRAAGWRVGIVTNGMADNQLGKIQRTGLADVVDGYAVSGAEGVRKPEPGLFQIAAQRCGVTLAGGGWMVGDSLVADVEGARTAGLRAIWIDRGTWQGHEHHADHVVSDVLEGIAIMRQAQ
ncbi:HAD-IIIA family hydrolase [Nonomuraea sp. NPDC000554]|uniref:HAD family hydrolase n=1 Tax=Nonomuraea sp. NPDC000554 TaxID=3154259 RepID=UPI0033325F0C